MPTTTVERIYLELRRADAAPAGAAPAGVAPAGRAAGAASDPGGADRRLERVRPCPVPLFRRLYREVGARHHWRDRDLWSDEQLARHLARADVDVWVLFQRDEPVGFFELAHHAEDASTEIAYFGLVPGATGRGLGRWLLERAIDAGWRTDVARLWLHTCSLDAAAALPNYRARGFREFRRERYEAELPD